MEIFDVIGKKASEAYKITADKTGKIAKETKLKLRMGELKTKINTIYQEIGKKVYEKHVREEEISIKEELEEQCTELDVLSDEMDNLLTQCLELKDKKQCPNCYAEIEKQVNYCPNCGTKQEKLKDVEEKEIEFTSDIKLEQSIEKKDEKKEKTTKEESKENNNLDD